MDVRVEKRDNFYFVKQSSSGSRLSAEVQRLRVLRRVVVIFIILSVALAAGIGIVTQFVGTLIENQSRIFETSGLIAGLSITAICHLSIAGRNVRFMAFLGLAVSIVASVAGAALVWDYFGPWAEYQDLVSTGFVVSGLLAISLAQTNLLLLLASRRRRVIQAFLAITLVTIGLVFGLVTAFVVTDGQITGQFIDELYIRALLGLAILDALGSFGVPLLGVTLVDRTPDGFVTLTVNLPQETADMLKEWTTESGQSAEDVIGALLHLGLKI
jgi:hypothetical protein